jgi:hypothetical protein
MTILSFYKKPFSQQLIFLSYLSIFFIAALSNLATGGLSSSTVVGFSTFASVSFISCLGNVVSALSPSSLFISLLLLWVSFL